jgi:prepilin-type N-terminal cleavage/methylation domain-containing protein
MLGESESSRVQEEGFSLIELLIVLAVFTLIMGGVFTVLGRSQNRYDFEQEVADIQQTARNCIDLMEREIRLVGFPKASYYDSTLGRTESNSNLVSRRFIAPSGTTTSATDLLFEGDIDEDGIVDVIEYRLNNNNLERSAVDKPAGAGAAAPSFQVIAQNVAALNLTYFDPNGNATTTPAAVQAVQIVLTLTTTSLDPENRNRRTITVQTRALVRN